MSRVGLGRRDAPQDPRDAAAAENTALQILNGAAQSSMQLRRRLLHRGYDEDVVDAVVTGLTERGWIDDARLAASLIGRRQRTGHGRMRIAADLRARGIEVTPVHDEAADEAEQERAVEAARRELLRRGLSAERLTRADAARVGASLQRRGFDGSTIRTALRMLSPG